MFEKLAKFWPLQSWHHVPGPRHITPAKGNHTGDHRLRSRQPRLVCRWSPIEGTDRLACRWEIETSDGPYRSFRGNRQFHKTFFEPSYQPDPSRLARLNDGPQPLGVPDAPAIGSLPVLHARHSTMPSDADAGAFGLLLRTARRELCLSSMGLPGCCAGMTRHGV
jgi:hypothetical protein